MTSRAVFVATSREAQVSLTEARERRSLSSELYADQ